MQLFIKAINAENEASANQNAEANAKAQALGSSMQTQFENTGEMGM